MEPNYRAETRRLAAVIADNCISCGRCVKVCRFLAERVHDPKKYFGQLENETDPLTPYSCTFCRQCVRVCPDDLDQPHAYLLMRQDWIKSRRKNPLKALRAVDFHQRLSFSPLFCAIRRGKTK